MGSGEAVDCSSEERLFACYKPICGEGFELHGAGQCAKLVDAPGTQIDAVGIFICWLRMACKKRQ